jgi:hypothetical protein
MYNTATGDSGQLPGIKEYGDVVAKTRRLRFFKRWARQDTAGRLVTPDGGLRDRAASYYVP